MKNLMKILTLILLFVTISFISISCRQQESIDTFSTSANIDAKNSSLASRTSNRQERFFTDEEIENIGIQHHLNLQNLLVDNNNNPITDLEGLQANSLIKYPELSNQQDNINYLIDNSTNLEMADLYKIIDENPNFFNNQKSLKSFLEQAVSIYANYTTYENFSSQLTTLENSARNTLVGYDLDTFLVFTSVYKYSATFWTADNNYDNLTGNRGTRQQVINADGLSAAIGFFVLAAVMSGIAIATTGGLATPAVVAIMEIAGIGFGAALSSGAAYLGLGG